MTTRDDVLFGAELSARYHRRRATFLDRASSAMSVVILAGGAGAFASLFGETTLFAKIATFVLAIVGVIQTVFQVDRAASDHRRWLAQWMAIIVEVQRHETPTPDQINDWVARRYSLESECVGELRALQVDCLNRTITAMNREGALTPMRWWHRSLIQILSFESAFANPVPDQPS